MYDLNALYFFVQIVDHGGLSAAERALGIPKSKLSRHLAALEQRLDVRLVQRSTRKFSVTDIGQVYYDHCKAMLVEAQAAQEAIDVRRAEPRGIVRITCPVALLHAEVGDMLVSFMADHPRVSVQLEASNRRVDPVGEGIDIALRALPPPLEDSDLVLRILSSRRQSLVASPLLINRLGPLDQPSDLAGWPSLQFGMTHDKPVWRLLGPNAQQLELFHQPRLITGDMDVLRQAARAGIGVVQLPKMLVRTELQEGSLIDPLPGWAPEQEIVHAVFPSRRGLLPSVRALIDYLAEHYQALADN